MQKLNLNSFIFSDTHLKDIKICFENLKFKQKNSMIFQNGDILIKVIFAQKAADYFRRYFSSQAKREYFGSIKLNKIGISTPKVYGYAYNLNPFAKIDSLLFIENIEGITLFDFFNSEKNSKKREEILHKFAIDIEKMANNTLFHKDINFGNIILKENRLFWIDNDIKIKNIEKIKYLEKIKDKNKPLSKKEIELIEKLLTKKLKR